jgi:high affinity Mn2+ porin
MGNYKEATQLGNPNIELTRNYKNSKFGFALNVEQGLTNEVGSFFRTSWNDGKTESWAFTEIDKSISGGLVSNGAKWNRTNDYVGIAYIGSGLSSDHQAYLAAGGLGFGLGDGKLNYAVEHVAELYYLSSIVKNRAWLTGTYQWIKNPGYNADRKGPAQIFSIRLHVSI